MNKQSELFDLAEARRLRDEGKRIAAENRIEPLELARDIAVELGERFGRVNIDMVMRVLIKEHGIESLGPAAGSVFRGPAWEFTGKLIQSQRIVNHGRLIRVWRYLG